MLQSGRICTLERAHRVRGLSLAFATAVAGLSIPTTERCMLREVWATAVLWQLFRPQGEGKVPIKRKGIIHTNDKNRA